jgi:eukaryotic-like serine/threonine-protein kinase
MQSKSGILRGCLMPRLASAHSSTRFGVFELDLQTGELRKSGVLLHLPPQPFKVLALLVSRPTQLVTREEIRTEIWGSDTFVDFEHGLNAAIKTIRDTLGDDPETPRYIETLPRRGYRFIAPLNGVAASSETQASLRAAPAPKRTASGAEAARRSTRFQWALISGAVIVVIAVAVGAWLLYSRKAPMLSQTATIVLADFINSTGDPVFDGTLRQGLSAQLQQSPFLDILSDDEIAVTLRLMEKPPDTRLTHDVAREVCQRTSATAVIEGSIAALGSQYVLGLNAFDCRTGNMLAQEQVTAEGKENVLAALGSAAAKLRSKLGETRASLEKFDAPLDQVTTSSLEALQAWSLGMQAIMKGDLPSAISFLQTAVDIDPKLASAYSLLGNIYS